MLRKRNNQQPVDVKDPRLFWVKRVARLMDEQFSIGGFKFGLDPLLNLIPVAGDLGSYIISVALIITMLRFGASGKLVAKMLANATLDALIGAIPVLGWVFDFVYKANTRNLALLEQHYTEGRHQGSGRNYVLMVLLVMLVVLSLLVYLSVLLLLWLGKLVAPVISGGA